MVRFEGIYEFWKKKRIGYEVLFDLRELRNLNKERFFEAVDEAVDFEIFEMNVRKVREKDEGSYYFFNIKPSTLLYYFDRVVSLLGGKDVIELREDHISEELLKDLARKRKDVPFLLSLDDFGRSSSNLDRIILLKPNFVKVEVPLYGVNPLRNLVRAVKSFDRRIYLVAEKVEDYTHLSLSLSAGFDFWQGFLEKKISNNGKKFL